MIVESALWQLGLLETGAQDLDLPVLVGSFQDLCRFTRVESP
jgi:hypothetical protein